MNAKRSVYNLSFGILSQIIAIAMGVLIPRLVLINLGSESNGLLSSIQQTLVYLNLLEAGVGGTTLIALYKPVALDEKDKINQVLSATNIYYKRIGTIYLGSIFVLSVLYPLVVSSEIPGISIFICVFLGGFPQVINFWFQGKYRILLQAEGKNYILTNLSTVVNMLISITKIILLSNGFNVVAIQVMYCVYSLVQMIYIYWYMNKHYAWIDFSVQPDYNALSQKNAVLVHQVSGVIFKNVDVVLLSIFAGLKTVSVYSMYVMLFGMVNTAIVTVNNSVGFVLGQTYNTDRNRFMKLYDAYESYYLAINFSLYCIACMFIIPFLKLYTSGVTDINYIDEKLPILFVLTYLFSNLRTAPNKVIEFAAQFRDTQKQAIIETVLNIVVSILCVKKYGIYGVLMGTVAALLYRANEIIYYAAKNILKRSALYTYVRGGTQMLLFCIILNIWSKIMYRFDFSSYLNIIVAAIIACVFVIPSFFVLASIVDIGSFIFCKEQVSELLKKLRSRYL